MAADHLLAIDLGTSAVKLMIINRDLRVMGVERVPSAGLNVETWVRAIRERTMPGSDPERISAIAVTGQMHGLVPLEADGFGMGIPWTDQRGTDALPALEQALGPKTIARLGGPLASGFQAVSLAWLRDNEPERWRRIQRVMLPKDALIFRLTGEHVTDPSDAVGTGMFAPGSGEWAWDVVEAIGIRHEWLPRIAPSGSIAGSMTPEAARALRFREGTPVVIVGGDAAAGAVGGNVMREGQALILLSTGAQILQPTAAWRPDPEGRWYTWPAAISENCDRPRFLRAGTLLNAGITTTWARQTLAASGAIAPEPSGLLMLPHLIGERTPLRDPLASGAILGIRPGTTAADISRAVLEGVAFSLRHALETMTSDGADPSAIRLGGGGAHYDAWQGIIADVLGIPTERVDTPDLSARGAAVLGAHALGWIDLAAWVPDTPEPSDVVAPNPARHRQYSELYTIYREAVDAVAPISHRLAAWRRAEP